MLNGVSPLQLACFDMEKPDLIELYNDCELEINEVFATHPVFDKAKCRYCGVCANYCTDGALQFNRYVPSVTFIVARCTACGRCLQNCTRNGISMKQQLTGKIISFDAGNHRFIAAELDQNSEFRVPLLKALLSGLHCESTVICDFGPGDSNDVRIALPEMDIAVILIQPETQWEQKLKSMLEMVKAFNLTCGIILNKIGNEMDFVNELTRFSTNNSIPLLGIIPETGHHIADTQRGEPAHHAMHDRAISEIWNNISALIPTSQQVTEYTST